MFGVSGGGLGDGADIGGGVVKYDLRESGLLAHGGPLDGQETAWPLSVRSKRREVHIPRSGPIRTVNEHPTPEHEIAVDVHRYELVCCYAPDGTCIAWWEYVA